MVDDAPGAPGDDAARRRLQSIAYGRDSSDQDRRAALLELTKLGVVVPLAARPRQSVRSVAVPPAAAAVPGSLVPALHVPESAVPGGGEHDAFDDQRGDAEPAAESPAVRGERLRRTRRRRHRRLALVVAILVLAALALVVGRSILLAGNDVYSREQTASDRSIPDWLINAFGLVGARMQDPGLAERLTASVRRVESGDLVGYVFRDTTSGTVCLGASQGIDCARTDAYPGEGLIVTVIDPRDPENHELRYELLPDSGFRGQVLAADRPASLQTMRPDDWPPLVTGCLGEAGFTATADAAGDLDVTPVGPDRQFELQMAVVNCSNRYPLSGQYLAVEP